MTTVERHYDLERHFDLEPRSDAAAELATSARLIAVGIGDAERDAGAVAWAVYEARGADVVHLVHAYVPVRIPETTRDPFVDRWDAHLVSGRVLISDALQRIRSGGRVTAVDGSAIAGLPADVLFEFSGVVDLVVLSEDQADAGSEHQVAHRMARTANCPVVVVPPDFDGTGQQTDGPVVLLVDSPLLPTEALEFAYDEAVRSGVSLCVAQLWSAFSPDAATAESLAARQQRLDMQLVGFERGEHPLGIFSELLLDGGAATIARLRQSSKVLVVGSTSARMGRHIGQSEPGACPVIVVPTSRPAWR